MERFNGASLCPHFSRSVKLRNHDPAGAPHTDATATEGGNSQAEPPDSSVVLIAAISRGSNGQAPKHKVKLTPAAARQIKINILKILR
jgi:hypothetical protein